MVTFQPVINENGALEAARENTKTTSPISPKPKAADGRIQIKSPRTGGISRQALNELVKQAQDGQEDEVRYVSNVVNIYQRLPHSFWRPQVIDKENHKEVGKGYLMK